MRVYYNAGRLRLMPYVTAIFMLILFNRTYGVHVVRVLQRYVLCKDQNMNCLVAPVNIPTFNFSNAYLLPYVNDEVKEKCAGSNVTPSSKRTKLKIKMLNGNDYPKVMYCKSSTWLTVREINQKIRGIYGGRFKRQASYTPRGRYRGQTQSQYLTVNSADSKDEGKAEAHSSADLSRASVSGKSGMGQAQSQTMFDPSCDDCFHSNDPGAENLERRPSGNSLIPGQSASIGFTPGKGEPGGLGSSQVNIPTGTGTSSNRPGVGTSDFVPGSSNMRGDLNPSQRIGPDRTGGPDPSNGSGSDATTNFRPSVPVETGGSYGTNKLGNPVANGNYRPSQVTGPSETGYINSGQGNGPGSISNFRPSQEGGPSGNWGYTPGQGRPGEVIRYGSGHEGGPSGPGNFYSSQGGDLGERRPNYVFGQNIPNGSQSFVPGPGTGPGQTIRYGPGQGTGPSGTDRVDPNLIRIPNGNYDSLVNSGNPNGFQGYGPVTGVNLDQSRSRAINPSVTTGTSPNQSQQPSGTTSFGNGQVRGPGENWNFGLNQGGPSSTIDSRPGQGDGSSINLNLNPRHESIPSEREYTQGPYRQTPGQRDISGPWSLRPGQGNSPVYDQDSRLGQSPIGSGSVWPFTNFDGSSYFCCVVGPNTNPYNLNPGVFGGYTNPTQPNSNIPENMIQKPNHIFSNQYPNNNFNNALNWNKPPGYPISGNHGAILNSNNGPTFPYNINGGVPSYSNSKQNYPYSINGIVPSLENNKEIFPNGYNPSMYTNTNELSPPHTNNRGTYPENNNIYSTSNLGSSSGNNGVNNPNASNDPANANNGLGHAGGRNGIFPNGDITGNLPNVNNGPTNGNVNQNFPNSNNGMAVPNSNNEINFPNNFPPGRNGLNSFNKNNENYPSTSGIPSGSNDFNNPNRINGPNNPNFNGGTNFPDGSSNGINTGHQPNTNINYGLSHSPNGANYPNNMGTPNGYNGPNYPNQGNGQGLGNASNMPIYPNNYDINSNNGVVYPQSLVPSNSNGGNVHSNGQSSGVRPNLEQNNANNVPQNVINPNSTTLQEPDDSEALATVSQDTNGTIASASSKGGNNKGRAQTQVQGTYTGNGSFSAQAQITDETKGAESQVSGGKHGASSNAQGHGKNNKAVAGVQLGSETGSVQTQAQSEGDMHSSNSQVQGSVKGGMADAQARGPGSTSSQAQIGFTPYNHSDNSHDSLKVPFSGGGTASAQSSGRTGQSQSQLQGIFKYGIKYNGAAQAGSSLDKDAVFSRRIPFNQIDVFDESEKNINVDALVTTTDTALDMTPSSDVPFDSNVVQTPEEETLRKSESRYSGHTHADHHRTDSISHTPVLSTPAGTRRSFQPSYSATSADYEYVTDKEETPPDEYEQENAEASETSNVGDNEHEYPTYDEPYNRDAVLTHQSLHKSDKKNLEVKQTTGGNTQHVVLGPLNGRDAEIIQRHSELPDQSRVYQPGEQVPGTGGYTIPIGFTGSIKSVASKENTYAIGSRDSPSQAQTIALKPGTGKVKYVYPKPTNNVNPKSLRSLTTDENRYVSVSKSVTGALDSDNNIKKQYSHTYYTKSSSCGYFTFTCTIVSGSEGRKKVCKPKIPTNPDGSPMRC